MLAERSQSQKTTCIIGFHLYEMSRTDKSTEVKKIRLPRARVLGEKGVTANCHGIFWGRDKNILKLIW